MQKNNRIARSQIDITDLGIEDLYRLVRMRVRSTDLPVNHLTYTSHTETPCAISYRFIPNRRQRRNGFVLKSTK